MFVMCEDKTIELEDIIGIKSEHYGEDINSISDKGANGPKSYFIDEESNVISVFGKSADAFRGGTGSQSESLFTRNALTLQVIYGRHKDQYVKINGSKPSADYKQESPVHSKIQQSVSDIIIKCDKQQAVKYEVQVDKVLEATFTRWQERSSEEAKTSKQEDKVTKKAEDHNYRNAARSCCTLLRRHTNIYVSRLAGV